MHVTFHAEQLLAREVGHIAAELPGRQRRLHVRGIRQFAAGEVQQNRSFFIFAIVAALMLPRVLSFSGTWKVM